MKNSRTFRISGALLIAFFIAGCGGGSSGGGVLAPAQAYRSVVVPLRLQPRGQTKIGGGWKHAYAVAVDQSTHDVYVSDDNGVRKIEPNGSMKNVGSGLFGARGIAVDSSTHDVYVSDSREVKVIHPDGRINTVGSGFKSPNAVSVDPNSHNVYVGDTGTHKVWVVVPSGQKVEIADAVDVLALSAIPGKGHVYGAAPDVNSVFEMFVAQTPIPFGSGWRGPVGVAYDAITQHVYVSTLAQHEIWDQAPDGSKTVVGGDFKGPVSLAVDWAADRLYVVDHVENAVYRITNAASENIRIDKQDVLRPAISGLAFDPKRRDLYVMAHITFGGAGAPSWIVKVAKDGSIIPWYDVGSYNRLPALLAVDDNAGDVYFLSQSGGGLYRIRQSDQKTDLLASDLNSATALAVDSNTHDVYVGIGNHVDKIAPDGTTTEFEKGVYPAGIAVDPTTHDLYVSDFLFVRRYNPDGTVARKYNYLQFPTTLAFDPATKTFYFQALDKLKRVTPDDRIEVVGEGFKDVRGLTIDPLTGSVYVADWNKANNIWKFVP